MIDGCGPDRCSSSSRTSTTTLFRLLFPLPLLLGRLFRRRPFRFPLLAPLLSLGARLGLPRFNLRLGRSLTRSLLLGSSSFRFGTF
jgi:hypothetical protein